MAEKLIKDYSSVMVQNMRNANLPDTEIIAKLSHEYNVAMDLIYTLLLTQTHVITMSPYHLPTNIDKWKELAKQYNIEIKFT